MNPNYKKILIPTLLSLILIAFLAAPTPTAAQGLKNINQGIDTTAQSAGVKSDATLIDLLAMLVQVLLGMLGLVFMILIIYGGVQWMTAAGNEEKVLKAKKLLINSVIGFIIIILSYAIAFFVLMAMQNANQ